MVSPHFPPDTSAGAHRVRLLAPHLPKHGWLPTVVTVRPEDYEGRLDPGLEGLVPPDLRVVRAAAWPARRTRWLGVGDLGLRALRGLYRTCARLLKEESFDALFVTMLPGYTALLGPSLKRRYGVAFILDYQDPWVGAWGANVGGGPDGAPDLKSRVSRWLACRLEPRVLGAVDAVTAVSSGTYDEVYARNPWRRGIPTLTLPLGGEPADFERVRTSQRPNAFFSPGDGLCHVCYVGTLAPLGFETLRAVLRATAELRTHRPELYARLRLHFFGTSNQTKADAPCRVLPVAAEIGVAECVSEIAPRIDYLEALSVLAQSNAILLMGSSERHYTASKLYPALLAQRPLLAIYHEASSVVDILRRAVRPPTARLVTYDDEQRAESRVREIFSALAALLGRPAYDPADIDSSVTSDYSAAALAGKLAALLDQVVTRAVRG